MKDQKWLDIEPATTIIDGVTYELHPGKIESTMLGTEDHGIFTFCLNVNYGGSAQGVGLMCLDKPVERYSSERIGTAYGHDLIIRVLKTVGVDDWEQLKGKSLYVIKDEETGHYMAYGIASWPDASRWLIFKEHAARFFNEDGTEKEKETK